MNLTKLNLSLGHVPSPADFFRRAAVVLLFLGWLHGALVPPAAADPAANTKAAGDVASNAEPHFTVTGYTVQGSASTLLSASLLASLLSPHTGTNVSLAELVRAAADVQAAYRSRGYPRMSVAIAPGQITNGLVVLNTFQTAVPQIVVAGKRYLSLTNAAPPVIGPWTAPASPAEIEEAQAALSREMAELKTEEQAAAAALAATNSRPPPPASPAEIEQARAELFRKMADLTAREKDTRIHVVSTNPGPRFAVNKYLVLGNSILPPDKMALALTNIDGAFGTNVSFAGIRTVVAELQQTYRERGYVTVAVSLPQQKLTNETVKVQVTEGRLAAINVTGNRYFSSNNVMRALPSLHTNLLLNGPVFQAELNRANANQDRQIYPVVGPGPEPGTSALTLKVKDQLPLHGKVEFNNQNTPGTPALRVNASAVADNLWQLDHSLGVQYSFSPEAFKQGRPWDFYDAPQVATYSAFYRLPLGNPQPIGDVVANNPDAFGYDEATRRFNLPPPSGATELNLYASRATIDTGLETLLNQSLFDIPFVRQVTQQKLQEGITVNQDLGFQLTKPLPQVNSLRSTLAGGLDFKTYTQENDQTNVFTFIEWTKNGAGTLNQRISHVYAPTVTEQKVEYLPLGLNYNAALNNFMGPATFGLGLSANLWYDSTTFNGTNVAHGLNSLRDITGSSESSGHWVILRPSYSQDIMVYTNWVLTARADGQWASEPLISNEQFGIGGVNSVRGYHEGEVFGDTGWHLSLEQQTPPHVVGIAYDGAPLTIRGSVYMDCATAYLLDPQGQNHLNRPSSTELWGTGFGLTASVGSHWQARFLFSVPLISTYYTPRDQPYFNFILTAQF